MNDRNITRIAMWSGPRNISTAMMRSFENREDTIVIDVGINKTDKGIVGDVDFDGLFDIASAITPVPGGVGPMTITMLLYNTVKSAEKLIERNVQ